MSLFIALITIKTIFLGAVYGRLDGGGIAKVSEWVERSLIMFFFVLACAPFAGYWSLLAYAGVLGIATGHGQYFLDRAIKYLGKKADGSRGSSERVDPFVTLFFGKDPRTDTKFNKLHGAAQTNALRSAMNNYGMKRLYFRNVFGMFTTGTLTGLPACVIAICFGAWIPAVAFSLTGVVKALAYVAGRQKTEPAEFYNGGGRNVLCLIAIYWFFI